MTSQGDGRGWALILGASSGFGGATALELARSGFDIFGVHLDLRSTLPNAQAIVQTIEAEGRRAVFFNMNAADAEKRAEAMAKIAETTAQAGSLLRVLLQSLLLRQEVLRIEGFREKWCAYHGAKLTTECLELVFRQRKGYRAVPFVERELVNASTMSANDRLHALSIFLYMARSHRGAVIRAEQFAIIHDGCLVRRTRNGFVLAVWRLAPMLR